MNPYVIGLIASDGHCTKNYWTISQIIDNAPIVANVLRVQDISDLDIRVPTGSYSEKERLIIKNKNKQEILLLKKWGIPIGNKTYNLNFPKEIDNEKLWLYMSGFFEGDGSIYLEDKKYPRASIICCRNWGKNCQNWLEKNDISCFWSYDKRHDGIGNLYIKQISSVKKFMIEIYKDIQFSNTPKYQKWQEVLLRLKFCDIFGRKVANKKEKELMTEEASKFLLEGYTAHELSVKFDYSIGFFIRLKSKLNLSRADIARRKEDEVKNLLLRGKSNVEIRSLGYGDKILRRVFDSLYGSPRKRKIEKEEKVRSLILKKTSIKDICSQYDCSPNYVVKIKKKMNLEGLDVKMNKRRKKNG